MLTREETAKAISLYLYANVHYRDYTYCVSDEDYEKENNHELNYLRVLTPSTLTTSYSGSIVSRDVSKIKLLLTPLSAITDEHAVEVAKMYGGVRLKIDQDGFIQVIDENNMVPRWFIISTIPVELYMYLISKSYEVPLFFGIDHPCNGKTAIECGIAIIKQ